MKVLFLMLILILAFKELKSMEHYLLVTVEHHQYNLTNQQGPAFVRLQRRLQVNVNVLFCLNHSNAAHFVLSRLLTACIFLISFSLVVERVKNKIMKTWNQVKKSALPWAPRVCQLCLLFLMHLFFNAKNKDAVNDAVYRIMLSVHSVHLLAF